MQIADILSRLTPAQQQAHHPQFHIEPSPLGFRLFDGDREIGLAHTRTWFFFDLWGFSPFEGDIQYNDAIDPYIIDMHTCRNSNVNLPYYHAGHIHGNAADVGERMKVSWPKSSGDSLELQIEGVFEHDQRILYRIRFCYDAEQARYRYFIDVDCWSIDPTGWEPLNFMMVGALHSRDEGRRWSHSTWTDHDGKVRRLVHSNALFTATDYESNRWRNKSTPLRDAWIAYTLNPDCNPAMLVHNCNVPMYFSTCSQLFDEHMIWYDATSNQMDGNHFHLQMHTEFVNLPVGLATELHNQAEDAHRPESWRSNKIALPFHMDIENNFAEAADVWAPEDCPLLVIDQDRSDVVWDHDTGHSNSHSIRLTGDSPHGWKELYPCGAVCNTDRHARYRFSAWVKTEGAERFARLELCSYEYTYNNKIDIAHSVKQTGNGDWTQLTVELDSEDEAYMMPKIQLYGRGRAWFDDLQFVRV